MRRVFVVAAVLALTACGGGGGGEGGGVTPVAVRDAWARPTPAGTTSGAVYFELEVAADDVLLGASAPSVAGAAELHESVTGDGGAMAMHELDHGLALHGGEVVVFEPGGLHVMLIELVEPLLPGDRFELTLDFQHAGPVTIEVIAR